uniref:Phage protein n=1 Tax=Ascaris lumbricoides TaxID=6252 RepID=A0A0M3HWE7_ASCLU
MADHKGIKDGKTSDEKLSITRVRIKAAINECSTKERTSNEWTIDRRARKDAIDAIMTIVDMTKLRNGVADFDSPCIRPGTF